MPHAKYDRRNAERSCRHAGCVFVTQSKDPKVQLARHEREQHPDEAPMHRQTADGKPVQGSIAAASVPRTEPVSVAEKLSATGNKREREMRAKHERFILMVKADPTRNYAGIAKEIDVLPQTAYGWLTRAADDGLINISGMLKSKPKTDAAELAEKKPVALKMVRQAHRLPFICESLGVAEGTLNRWIGVWKREGVLPSVRRGEPNNNDPLPYEMLNPVAKSYLEPTVTAFGRFCEEILGLYAMPWHGEAALELLEMLESEDDEYAVVNAPPGVGKTTLITFAFVCWMAVRERAYGRECPTSLGHASEGKAKWYLQRLRRTFETNTKMIELYGRFQPTFHGARWSLSELDLEPLDRSKLFEKEPSFSAQSYEKSQLSGRFKVIIWDDLVDKKNSATVEQREKLEGWWENDAETRLEPGGLMVLSNARYGPEDLTFRVRQAVDEDDLDETTGEAVHIYRHIKFRAHDESKCRVVGHDPITGKSDLEHFGPQPEGCLLDPVRLNWRKMRKARANSTRFALVYQQEDTDPVGNLAQRVWFEGGTDKMGALAPGCFEPGLRFGQAMERDPQLGQPISIVTVDPSGSKYWAVVHWLVWPDRVHQVYRAARRPLQAPELLYREENGEFTGILADWWTKAEDDLGKQFTYLVIEANACQRWATQYEFFRTWCGNHNVALIPHTTNRSNKPDLDLGVEMLGPIYQHGQVRIPTLGLEEKIFAETFRREACAWPEAQTSDVVMAHWFLGMRLDMLIIAEMDRAERQEWPDERIPPWRSPSKPVPAFAREIMKQSREMAV